MYKKREWDMRIYLAYSFLDFQTKYTHTYVSHDIIIIF